MSIKVSKLKQTLQDALDSLEGLDDNQEINLVSNTYFLHSARVFIGFSGYDGGYLDLNNIEDNLVDDDNDDEEE